MRDSVTAPEPVVDGSRRRRRRRSRSRFARHAERHADRLLPALLITVVAGSVLAIGTVHTVTLLVIAPIAFAGAALAWRTGAWVPIPAATLALVLAAYTLLQAVPLPLSVLSTLSPASADTWQRALQPLGETVSWGSLSVDRGASLVEALKWLTYAAVFGLSATVGARRGALFVPGVLFATACVVAVVSLGHGLLDLKQVYGLYTPTFTPQRWSTSPLLNPNNLSGYLNLGAFAGLGLLISSRAIGPRWVIVLGTALVVAQSVLTASRGGVLSLLVGLFLLVLLVPRIGGNSRRSRRPFWTWQVVAALLGGLVLTLLGATRATWDELYQEGLEKLSVVEWTIPLIRDHAWFGVGGGAFETAFPAYRVLGGPKVWAHPENFLVAWLSEWGLLVGTFAFGSLVWIFRPSRLGAHRSRLAACVAVGVFVLCLQNFVDLGFSLPGVFIGLAALLGGTWGAWNDQRTSSEQESEASRSGDALRRGVPPSVVVAGALCLVLVLAGGLRSARVDRDHLAATYRKTEFTQLEARETFFADLRAAMLRHPGEPFFPQLGALAALRTPGANPLPWVARALERDMMSGRLHLLLAEILAQRDNRGQALLHLRLAAEREPSLASTLASRALTWAESHDDLARTVPDHEVGAAMLSALARRLRASDPDEGTWRRRFLEEALRRDRNHVSARSLLAHDLLDAIVAQRDPCVPPARDCHDQVRAHLVVLRESAPRNSNREVELEGYWLATEGKREEGIALLLERCKRSDTSCLKRAVTLSAETDDLPLDLPTQAYLAAACRNTAGCESARLWVGNLYAERQLWGPALAHYTRAAETSRNPRVWLRLADAASRQGAHRRALDALRRAENLPSAKEPALANQLAEARRVIIERMAKSPSAPAGSDSQPPR